MKQNKITQQQADDFNEWQQKTGSRPIYGSIDIDQLALFTDTLSDESIFADAVANKIAADWVLLVSNYFNSAQICEVEQVADVSQFSPVAVAMFRKFKPMIDAGFINYKKSYDKGSGLTAYKNEKQGKKIKAPASVEEMRQFCADNSLQVADWELEKIWRKNSRSHFAAVDDWQAYLAGIGKKHQQADRQQQLEEYAKRIVEEHKTQQ